MKLTFRFCGPKCSMCCSLLSVWGIIQLIIMGACLYNQNVAFAEDLPLEEHYNSTEEMHEAYLTVSHQQAVNCWIAAGIYAATLAISLHQFWLNNRLTETST